MAFSKEELREIVMASLAYYEHRGFDAQDWRRLVVNLCVDDFSITEMESIVEDAMARYSEDV